MKLTGSEIKKTVVNFKCEDFNALDDSIKPKIVALTEGYISGRKRPTDVIVDTEEINRITPVVIRLCKTSPREVFWDKVKKVM